METIYPQQLTVTAGVTGEDATSVPVRAWRGLDQLLCGLRGHDAMLHFERNRMMMRCASCGHESPGWEISGLRPRRRFEGDAHRHQIQRQHLELSKSA